MVISHCTGQVLINMQAHIFPFDSGLERLLRDNTALSLSFNALPQLGVSVRVDDEHAQVLNAMPSALPSHDLRRYAKRRYTFSFF